MHNSNNNELCIFIMKFILFLHNLHCSGGHAFNITYYIIIINTKGLMIIVRDGYCHYSMSTIR